MADVVLVLRVQTERLHEPAASARLCFLYQLSSERLRGAKGGRHRAASGTDESRRRFGLLASREASCTEDSHVRTANESHVTLFAAHDADSIGNFPA